MVEALVWTGKGLKGLGSPGGNRAAEQLRRRAPLAVRRAFTRKAGRLHLGSVEVEVRDGYVVSARDPGGRRWSSSQQRSLSRLCSHALVMGAVLVPFMVTAASAHQSTAPGRSAGRVLVLASELQAERDSRPVATALVQVEAPPPAPPAPPPPPPPPPRPFADVAPVTGGGGHFSFGWCTWYVSSRRYVPWMGNAIDWWRNAAAMSFTEGRTPRPGAIMVTRESGYGHVAFVESVDEDGQGWSVSEMNFQGFGVISKRHIRMGQVPLVGFIY
jgi:hypothetical protein